MQAELDKNHLINSFGFSKEDLKRSNAGCLAKSSFKINKAIDFDDLLKLITKIDNILAKQPKFILNKVVHLQGKRFEKLVDALGEELVNQIYDTYQAGQIPDFEICHTNFEQYLTADKYTLEINSKEKADFDDRPSWKNIIAEIKLRKSLLDDDVFQFKGSVLKKSLGSFDAIGTKVTSDTILDHMNGELTYKGNSYFHIDKGWYKIDPTFISDLNDQCVSVLKESWDDKLLTHKFDLSQDEREYNKLYINNPGALVLDTITPENIECCDVLLYDKDSITFVHIKKGFNNTIRDLASQVTVAAKRIRETIFSDHAYLEKVEARAKSTVKKDALRIAIAGQTFPSKGLVKLFKPRPENINFCLAFVDTAKTKRILNTDILEFGSNIAKYSLIELSHDLRQMGFGFKVVQIKNK